jgi:hypothetical protein
MPSQFDFWEDLALRTSAKLSDRNQWRARRALNSYPQIRSLDRDVGISALFRKPHLNRSLKINRLAAVLQTAEGLPPQIEGARVPVGDLAHGDGALGHDAQPLVDPSRLSSSRFSRKA